MVMMFPAVTDCYALLTTLVRCGSPGDDPDQIQRKGFNSGYRLIQVNIFKSCSALFRRGMQRMSAMSTRNQVIIALITALVVTAAIFGLESGGFLEGWWFEIALVAGFSLTAVICYAVTAPAAVLSYMLVGLTLGYCSASIGVAAYFASLAWLLEAEQAASNWRVVAGIAASDLVLALAALPAVIKVVRIEDQRVVSGAT